MKSEQDSFMNKAISILHSLAGILPQSRSGKITNILRQVEKFGKGLKIRIKLNEIFRTSIYLCYLISCIYFNNLSLYCFHIFYFWEYTF